MAMPHFIGVLIGSVANDDTQYAAHCQASNKAITTKFDESARAGTLMVLPQSMRPKSREEGEGNAAAAAMDKMFDFSSW